MNEAFFYVEIDRLRQLNDEASSNQDDRSTNDRSVITRDAAYIESLNINERIAILCSMDDQLLSKQKTSRRTAMFSLEQIKDMASHLGIKKSQTKPKLVEAILSYMKQKQQHDAMSVAQVTSSTSVDGNSNNGTYRKDKNTIPRLINLLFNHPNALARSQSIPSRVDIQDRQLNEHQEIWTIVCNEFMDRSHNSGGLMAQHDALDDIDTEKINNSGILTPKHAFKIFKDVLREYAVVEPNYSASGKHNEHDYFMYCNGNTDVLYLHLALEVRNHESLSQFCKEGYVLHNGLDSLDDNASVKSGNFKLYILILL